MQRSSLSTCLIPDLAIRRGQAWPCYRRCCVISFSANTVLVLVRALYALLGPLHYIYFIWHRCYKQQQIFYQGKIAFYQNRIAGSGGFGKGARHVVYAKSPTLVRINRYMSVDTAESYRKCDAESFAFLAPGVAEVDFLSLFLRAFSFTSPIFLCRSLPVSLI